MPTRSCSTRRPDPAALHELGSLLADHVRLEERELFPLIEAALPAATLVALATALEHAERCAGSERAGACAL